MTIDPAGAEHVYVQLANVLADRIAGGEWPQGRLIPSETTLMQEYGVARGTVRRAISVLRERGLVATVAQRGTYVV